MLESFKTKDGKHISEVKDTQINMVFKTVILSNNQNLICFNSYRFIKSVDNNLHICLLDNNKNEKLILPILSDIHILDSIQV